MKSLVMMLVSIVPRQEILLLRHTLLMVIAHFEHIHATMVNLGMTGLMFPSLNITNVVMIKKSIEDSGICLISIWHDTMCCSTILSSLTSTLWYTCEKNCIGIPFGYMFLCIICHCSGVFHSSSSVCYIKLLQQW